MKSICPKCGIVFENTTNRKFCSRKCANSHIQTKEQNEKRRDKLLGKKQNQIKKLMVFLQKQQEYYLNPTKCKICGNNLEYKDRRKKNLYKL